MKEHLFIKTGFYHFAILAACLAVISLDGSGCTTVHPDAVENDFKQSQTYPPVILTDNTETSLKTLAHRANTLSYINMGIGMDDVQPKILTDGIRQVLSERFQQAGGTSKSNLVMVFDARVKFGKMSGQITSLELSGTFKDGNQTIETVTGNGTSRIPFPALTCGFRKAADAAFDDFGRNLRDARELTAYLSAKPADDNSAPVENPQQGVTSDISGTATHPVATNPAPDGQDGNSVYTLLPSTTSTNPATTDPSADGNR